MKLINTIATPDAMGIVRYVTVFKKIRRSWSK